MTHQQYYYDNKKYASMLESQPDSVFAKYCEFALKYLPTGGKFLDAGCGSGIVLNLLNKQGRNITGIDVSQEFIEISKSKHLNAVLYDGGDFPFEDHTFDLVGTFNVLEHADDPYHFLNEMKRVVKLDGYIIIACPNFLSITNNYHHHTAGIIQKIQNIKIIVTKLLNKNLKMQKMNVIVRDDFHPDDDACNVTNPIDILNWGEINNLKVVYWSSQTSNSNIPAVLDKFYLRYLFGSSFIIFKNER